MLKKHSIKDLYPLALAEGEGVGTAYEYYAKRLILSRWLEKRKRPGQILIAGLPQIYGASMDFLLLAQEVKAVLTIIDDRAQAIGRCQDALNMLQNEQILVGLKPRFIRTDDLVNIPTITGSFDLALSSEVIQRLPQSDRFSYLERLHQLAAQVAIFTPNGNNPDHINHSGLNGLPLVDLEEFFRPLGNSNDGELADNTLQLGYIDMPPFPPGMTRSSDQREQATTGKFEALAMWGLGFYAQMEPAFPKSWRRNKSHIVYAFLDKAQR